jgi:Rrf2 family protein
MAISQKCQYGLRAVFELARRHGSGPIRIGEIAEAQAIPPRFLELILGELKQSGFVQSRRGVRGGYFLAVAPNEITVGQVIRFIEGPIAPIACLADTRKPDCPLHGRCAFMAMWERARDAVEKVYDNTTLQDLIDEERAALQQQKPSYSI